MDVNLERLRYLDDVMPANVSTIFSDPHTVKEHLALADLVVGAVLIPGATAPRLVTRKDLSTMKAGAVVVDVAIDQGGCLKPAGPPRTKTPPTMWMESFTIASEYARRGGTYQHHGVVQRDVAVCDEDRHQRFRESRRRDLGFKEGINLVGGKVTHAAVAESLGLKLDNL